MGKPMTLKMEVELDYPSWEDNIEYVILQEIDSQIRASVKRQIKIQLESNVKELQTAITKLKEPMMRKALEVLTKMGDK